VDLWKDINMEKRQITREFGHVRECEVRESGRENQWMNLNGTILMLGGVR